MKKLLPRKRRIGIYVAYIILCILLTVYCSRWTTENVGGEKYGLAKNDTIEMAEDTEIDVVFTLSENAFQGLSVKFQSENEFQDEVLQASLYDNHTEELLAESSAQLKYERIQNKDGGSAIYFPLPVEESQGKEVRLSLRVQGEDVRVCPSFVVSDTKVADSELFVDGKVQEKNLVFTTRYSQGVSGNVAGGVLNGILLLLIGTLIFFFAYGKENGDDLLPKKENKRFQRISRSLEHLAQWTKQKKKIIGFIGMAMILCFMFVFVYQYYVEPAMDQSSRQQVLKQEDEDQPIETIKEKESVRRIFLCKKEELSGIILSYVGEDIPEDAILDILVRDESTGKRLGSYQYRFSEEENSEQEIGLELEETLEKSKGHRISLELKPVNFGDATVELRGVTAEYGNLSFLKPGYAILCFLILGMAMLLYYFCFIRRISMEKLFVITAIPMGILFCLVIGLNTVPDEPSHMDTAYSISNKLLGVEEASKPGYMYKREEDIDATAEDKQSLNVYSYERLYHQLFKKAEDTALAECGARNNLANAGTIYYMPQAVGITIGRLMGWGMMPTYMLGRLFSLLCYVLLTYFALKKLPVGKASLFLIGILPISLQQAASMSYDGMINAVAFLYVSYCLYSIYKEGSLGTGDIVILAITGSLMATVKGGVYIPLCLLPLLKFVGNRRASKRDKLCMGGLVGIFLFAFIKNNLASTLSRLAVEQGTVTGGAASTEIYTFGYLLRYPHRFLGMFVNTIFKQGDAYIRNLFGGNLGWRDVNISWFIVIAMILVVLLSCISYGRERKITVKEKLWMGILVFGSYFCIELSMLLAWTPSTFLYITGVQGRYFLPFFLLVLLVLRGNFFRVKKDISIPLVFSGGMINIVTILQVVQRAMER